MQADQVSRKGGAHLLGGAALAALASVALVASSLAAPRSATLEIVQVSPSTAKDRDVVATVVRRNETRAPVDVVVPNGPNGCELYYDIAAVDGGGHPLARTRYGQSLLAQNGEVVNSSARVKTLAPGETVSLRCALDRVFVFPGEGRYTVSIREPHAGGAEASGTLTVR